MAARDCTGTECGAERSKKSVASGLQAPEASTTLEPGGFVSLPGMMHHFAWTATPTIVQVSLEGPFDIFYVNPSEDPQKRQSRR